MKNGLAEVPVPNWESRVRRFTDPELPFPNCLPSYFPHLHPWLAVIALTAWRR
jgi:hypothetical protein